MATEKASLSSRLNVLSGLGDFIYVEVGTPADAAAMQRQVSAPQRLAGVLKLRKFSTRTYTAVGSTPGDVRILVRIERVV